jgi:hypothetical protein
MADPVFFAVGSATELAGVHGGLGVTTSSVLGAMPRSRSGQPRIALIITVPVVMIVGSLSADAIVEAQAGYS